ncbi:MULTISPECIES: serine/threonine protein kinase [unclassified Psychrobacter]|uniref:serine/threonine protein kinase n=1 Tax=unclassified Psychrobacter TaxID=196806 RepID=UPI003FB7AEEF
MENSASNPSITQALQAQAEQLLSIITQELVAQNFSEIVHQRIAQQSTEQTQDIEEIHYQGVTRAQHSQFGQVMIKWQMIADTDMNNMSFDLTHEAEALTSVNALSTIEDKTIAAPLLAYHCVNVQALEAPQKLIITVMPYYPNGSLARQLSTQNQHSLTAQRRYHFLVQSAHLIANLHQAGWLHNDIKPSNILLEGSDNELPVDIMSNGLTPGLLLTDFALAQHITVAKSHPNLAGTLAYISPERWQGQGTTAQSDIYAFGVMMYEILAGKRPFQIAANSKDKSKAWAIQHCQQPIPKLPSEYSHYQCIVNKALAKRIKRRYQSMDAVLKELTSLDDS